MVVNKTVDQNSLFQNCLDFHKTFSFLVSENFQSLENKTCTSKLPCMYIRHHAKCLLTI